VSRDFSSVVSVRMDPDGRYRYTAERLQKTENVVEKYKKKLEESAGLRREFKVSILISLALVSADGQKLEEENLALTESKAALEAELKKTGSKGVAENTKSQLSALEKQITEQTNEVRPDPVQADN
jgi:protein HOOK3